MAYESVGDGRSVGVLPNYAAEDEQIQQGLAHRFDQYTNPFLLAHNISGVFQPGIENAQKQQMVNIDQARQNLAQTDQNTLLPLQANSITAQTDDMRARAAAMNYQLDTQKQGMSQFPDFMAAVGGAVNNNDPAALATAIGQNPAAVRLNPQLAMDAYNRISQAKGIETQGYAAAAAAKGSDFVSQNPNAQPSDILAAYTPSDGTTPAQQVSEKNAFLQGANHQQAQLIVQGNQSQMREAVAEIRANGAISSSLAKSLSPLVKTGQFSGTVMASLGASPDEADAIRAAVLSPNAQNTYGKVAPDPIALQKMKVAQSLERDPLASSEQRNWIAEVYNTGGHPRFDLPSYTPDVQDKIDNTKSQISNLQKLYESQLNSWGGKSDAKNTLEQIGSLNNDLANLRKNGAQRRQDQASQPAAPASQPTYDAASPLSFISNPFLPPDFNNVSSTTVNPIPGNPQTTAALDVTESGQVAPTIPTPIPGVSPVAQATASKSIQRSIAQASTPPPAAIAKLKANPALAEAFEAKYGKGSALRYLRE